MGDGRDDQNTENTIINEQYLLHINIHGAAIIIISPYITEIQLHGSWYLYKD